MFRKAKHINLEEHTITCERGFSSLFMSLFCHLSFNCSVGIDAARAFGTGCFATHRTHDLRGLSEAELAVSF